MEGTGVMPPEHDLNTGGRKASTTNIEAKEESKEESGLDEEDKEKGHKERESKTDLVTKKEGKEKNVRMVSTDVGRARGEDRKDDKEEVDEQCPPFEVIEEEEKDEEDNDQSDDDEDESDDNDEHIEDSSLRHIKGNHNGDEYSDDNDAEGGDTTDGAPPVLESTVREQSVKRQQKQSKRMQEYQEMQQSAQAAGRIFVCPEQSCRRVFNSGPGLRYHIMHTHQETQENFICDSCNREFKSLNGLKYHKRKRRCLGVPRKKKTYSSTLDAEASTSTQPDYSSSTLSLQRDEGSSRLLDLAHIATGPQSPLLQGLSPARSSSVGAAFFDSPEKNAVMALSSMSQKRTSQKSTDDHEEPVCGTSTGLSTEQDTGMKSKRPMNGFMLFAQKNRAEFNRMFPHTNNRMISTKLSEEWNKLPLEERQKWKEDARRMAEVQRSKHPDCWKRKKYTKDRN